MTQKNNNLSLLDRDQITRASFDADMDATRVTIVGMSDLGSNIANSISESLKSIKLDLPQLEKSVEYKEIRIPELVREQSVQIISVPEIIREQIVKTIEIEKPIYITEIKIVEVPLIVKEIEYRDLEKQVIVTQTADVSKFLYALIILQTISFLALSLFKH